MQDSKQILRGLQLPDSVENELSVSSLHETVSSALELNALIFLKRQGSYTLTAVDRPGAKRPETTASAREP